jgi:hypothetical protein
MSFTSPRLVLALAFLAPVALHAADPAPLPPPAQDQGLPYTRSAQSVALKKISRHLGVFAGSRYAYVQGYRTRLDPSDVLGGEAVLRDGRILVPAAFAGALQLGQPSPKPAPTYLSDRWVYDLGLPQVKLDTGAVTTVDGKPYVDLADLARAAGKKVYQHPRGLLLIGTDDITFTADETVLLDTVISQFDTPDKFADPDIATRYIPNLARQGKWTDHVKVTPEQLALLNGPETKWETASPTVYDFTGFNRTLLGSKVPAPGVYPRILFSPEDVPSIAKRLQTSRYGQMSLIEMKHLLGKSWWNPESSDGKLFRALVANDFSTFKPDGKGGFVGHTPVIHSSHVNYVSECLQTMALYCLLTNDDLRGREVAQAIANYYRSREADLDVVYARSDSEFGSSRVAEDGTLVSLVGTGAVTHGRGVTDMNRGLCLDFAGKWMTPEEKDLMRRIIAKSTYGRRAYGQDGSVRFRDINWMTWDLTQLIALSAIEGLEGFDREAYASNLASIKAFCDWGISPAGLIFESNGKTGPGTQFFMLATVAAARRGENNFGHPHLRKLLLGQIMASSPSGRVTVTSGTQYSPYSRSGFGDHLISELKGFFPAERYADYLLANNTGTYTPVADLAKFRAETESDSRRRVRLPSPTHPFGARTLLFDGDIQPAKRSDLGLPLDLLDPVEGMLSSYSDQTPDAVWLNFHVRPNHYLGAGHHHADAGMFHFSALGVDWFSESPFSQVYTGNLHNLVMVDGLSEPDGYQGAAKFLGGSTRPLAATASADLAYAYSWRWNTQQAPIWPEDAATKGWEMDPSPEIARIFAGTARYKMRPWWWNYNYSNYLATSRSPYNPVQRAYRTAGLVRGAHSYGFILDDIKKDDATRLYQWTAMLNGGVRRANVPGLASGQIALAYREGDPVMTDANLQPAVEPAPGEPLLIVTALGLPAQSGSDRAPILVERITGPASKKGETQYADRLTIDLHGIAAAFRVLLLPARAGQPLPVVSYNAEKQISEVRWPGQSDTLTFTPSSSGAPALSVLRGNSVITP